MLVLQAVLWDLIDPHSSFRFYWDLLLLVELVYVMLVSPFVICFGVDYRVSDPLGVLEIFIDCTFAIDIFLNFRTGIIGKGTKKHCIGIAPCESNTLGVCEHFHC